MDVNIHFSHTVNAQASLSLDQLADILKQDYDLPVHPIRQSPASREKDAGLTIALTIISISISAIGTLISALEYWRSQHPNYSVSVKSGNKTITAEHVEPVKLQKTISELEQEMPSSDTEVVISIG